MKLIVGLGNPGKIYINSRHNIGFLVIRALSEALEIPLKRDAVTLSLTGKGRISGSNIELAMPLTFMNLSGLAVSALVKKYKIDLANLLVVCDDLDLEFGRQKVRPRGSSGGHRGIQSIIDHLRSNEFARLRIGIGRPHPDMDAAEYVLSVFKRAEMRQAIDIISVACDCCQSWVSEGITKSMNIFNRRNNE